MIIGNSVCSKYPGGVERILLLPLRDIVAVDYSSEVKAFVGLSLREGCEPLEVAFAEGGVSIEERLRADGAVEHRLTFALYGIKPDNLHLLRAEASRGVVAIVEAGQDRLLVGYSAEAAGDYPLLLSSIGAECGSRRLHTVTTTVTLASTDSSLSANLYLPEDHPLARSNREASLLYDPFLDFTPPLFNE